MNIRTLVVDDHPMVCSGMCQEISKRTGFEVVGYAQNAAAAFKLACELTPDLILMDVHLPDSDGVAATRQILSTLRDVKIVIYTADVDRIQVDNALQAGARGYVLKSTSVEELFRALDMIVAGRMYISPEISSGILEDYRAGLVEKDKASNVLTERDKHLLRLIATGATNKEIAGHLNVGLSSVETYRSRLKQKLSCQSTADLVKYAIANKIVNI